MTIYAARPGGFDWDHGNREKCQKHGVPIREIELLLSGAARIAPALRHSDAEDRYIAVGRDSRGRALFVAFTLRQKGDRRLFRPISARYMHKKEIRGYEENESSQAQD
jgi:uncharacterized DUF497 family protein